MDRRSFFKLIASGVIGYELDLDRLLWVPGQKTIFIPKFTGLGMGQIVALEYERTLLRLRGLFDRDDIFYTHLKNRRVENISNRPMNVPLIIKGE